MESDNTYEKIIEEQLGSLDMAEIDRILGGIDFGEKYGYEIQGIGEIVSEIMAGNPLFSFEEIRRIFTEIFLNEVLTAAALITEIIVLCVVSGLLKSASSSLGESTVSRAGQSVCGYIAAVMCMGAFYSMYGPASEAIDTMTEFVQAMFPVMITLIVGSGGITTGAVINPVVLTAISVFAVVIDTVIFPAVFLSGAFFMINSLSENNYLKKTAGYIRKLALYIMSLCVMVFSGLSAIQGMVTEKADSVVMKAARYSVGNFVPVLGGIAADSFDLIKSCCSVIKSAAGVFGIIAVIAITAVPVIKLLVSAMVFKFAAAICEPLGSENISECLNETGNTIVALAAVVFLSALMFLIFTAMFMSFSPG